MSRELNVPVFAEDNAHEQFVTALLKKIAAEHGLAFQINVVSSRGGHGRALTEFHAYQLALEKQGHLGGMLVVAIDANCHGWREMRGQIKREIREGLFIASAIACPDPHIERWYLSDPIALAVCFSASFQLPRRKCERNLYKRLLQDALVRAGEVVTLGGAEFAAEIVAAMDLYRAGKNEPSLKSFIDEVRECVLARR
jgi:hypothetical protein